MKKIYKYRRAACWRIHILVKEKYIYSNYTERHYNKQSNVRMTHIFHISDRRCHTRHSGLSLVMRLQALDFRWNFR